MSKKPDALARQEGGRSTAADTVSSGGIGFRLHGTGGSPYCAPALYHFPISARSSSVMPVRFPIGIALSWTTCW